MRKKIANLINVKTIVTIVFVSVYSILALRGEISSDMVNNVTIMIISFYFGVQHEQWTEGNKNDNL